MDWFEQEENRLQREIMQASERNIANTMRETLSRMQPLIQQKNQELAIARTRSTELQRRLNAAGMEAAAWSRAAEEKEAIAADLQHRLRRARERERGDDAAAPSSSSGERGCGQFWDCKQCHAGLRCVVFGPCMHVCCCIACEPVLKKCPVCGAEKKETLQVSFPL